MVILTLSCRMRQLSNGRCAHISTSPNLSSGLPQIISPTCGLQAGEGTDKSQAMDCENSGLGMCERGPGSAESHACESLSFWLKNLTGAESLRGYSSIAFKRAWRWRLSRCFIIAVLVEPSVDLFPIFEAGSSKIPSGGQSTKLQRSFQIRESL